MRTPPFRQYLPGEPGVYGEKFSGRAGGHKLGLSDLLGKTGSVLNVDKAPPEGRGLS